MEIIFDGIMLVFWSNIARAISQTKLEKYLKSLNSTIYATNVQDFDILIGTLEMQATNSCVVPKCMVARW